MGYPSGIPHMGYVIWDIPYGQSRAVPYGAPHMGYPVRDIRYGVAHMECPQMGYLIWHSTYGIPHIQYGMPYMGYRIWYVHMGHLIEDIPWGIHHMGYPIWCIPYGIPHLGNPIWGIPYGEFQIWGTQSGTLTKFEELGKILLLQQNFTNILILQ